LLVLSHKVCWGKKLSKKKKEKHEAEIASDDEMSMMSENLSDDLPNQEKNQS